VILSQQREDAALALVSAGFLIVPIPEGRKAPVREAWQREATADPEQVRRWLRNGQQYGVYPPKGSGLLIIDPDKALEEFFPPLPATLTVDSSPGHFHLYGRLPPGVDEADIPRTFASGEVRIGGSGQVVGPWSRHPAGHTYTPRNGMTVGEIPMPWIEALRRSHEQKSSAQRAARGPEDEGWTIAEPGRHDFLLSRGRNLRGVGLSGARLVDELLRLNQERCSPPKTEAEVRAIVDWIEEKISDDPPPFTIREGASLVAERRESVWPARLAESAYHGVIGELVRAVEESTEADPAALLGSMLAVFGALCGNARTMHQGTWQAPHLYVALVGESSSGRKGTALSVVRDIFRLVDPDYGRLIVAGLGSGEGLVGHMKRLRADGATENRALVLETELGRLLAVMNREGSTLSPILRDGWDGTPLGRVLARDDMLVEDHHVALLGHITPRELRAKLTSTDAANGFGNRFLWMTVRRQRLVPFPQAPDGLVRGIWPPLARAVAHAQEQRVIDWTPAAADTWEAFYAEHVSRPRLGLIGALTARAEAQVTRLALIYALADGADAVDAPHLAAAREVWRYAEASARHIFGDSTGSRHADVLLRWLRAGDEYTWKDAKQALGLRTAADLEEVVELLVSADLAELVERPRPDGGRPARVIRAKGAKGAKDAAPAHENEHE
jgi:hypothetical protein